MPHNTSTLQPAIAAGQSAGGALTPERIEGILARFRDWIAELPEPTNETSRNGSVPGKSEGAPVDLHTLVGQFVALRHEVNLQTKSTRASLEQNGATLQALEVAVAELQNQPEPEAPDAGEELKPLLKAMIDVYDALALAARQVEKQKDKILAGFDAAAAGIDVEPPPEAGAPGALGAAGFWQRLFGGAANTDNSGALQQWRERTIRKLKEREQSVREATGFLRQALDGLLTGYTMSLNRIERLLPQFGVQAMNCVGKSFDPEIMEVVEAIAESGRPAGEVLEEVRRGYIWKEAVFRYAQVRVSK